jgi:hypothetical protein
VTVPEHSDGIRAAVDAAMKRMGLPTYGPHREVTEKHIEEAVRIYMATVGVDAATVAVRADRDRLIAALEDVPFDQISKALILAERHRRQETRS